MAVYRTNTNSVTTPGEIGGKENAQDKEQGSVDSALCLVEGETEEECR
jgi:hypothetical protein